MCKISLLTVFKKLSELYNPPKSFLNHRTPLDLLIVTILSAQCTDKRVNEVSKILYKKYNTAEDYVRVTQKELEDDIHSTGFFRTKAKNIQSLCHILIKKYDGEVPNSMEELTALPGVGRKTAAIILYVAFNKIEGIAVDTHVMRISQRLGFTKSKDPKKIEKDLMKQLQRKNWGRLNSLLISHGRAVCIAKKPKCGECVFRNECFYFL